MAAEAAAARFKQPPCSAGAWCVVLTLKKGQQVQEAAPRENRVQLDTAVARKINTRRAEAAAPSGKASGGSMHRRREEKGSHGDGFIFPAKTPHPHLPRYLRRHSLGRASPAPLPMMPAMPRAQSGVGIPCSSAPLTEFRTLHLAPPPLCPIRNLRRYAQFSLPHQRPKFRVPFCQQSTAGVRASNRFWRSQPIHLHTRAGLLMVCQ
ncbi:hypothetical protein GQ54DRAFT_60579 [Martensiomyces pterosporus]|nr:hypothetical protein GQ54DRAFT_60579 [Martensiomyces pterosporus]